MVEHVRHEERAVGVGLEMVHGHGFGDGQLIGRDQTQRRLRCRCASGIVPAGRVTVARAFVDHAGLADRDRRLDVREIHRARARAAVGIAGARRLIGAMPEAVELEDAVVVVVAQEEAIRSARLVDVQAARPFRRPGRRLAEVALKDVGLPEHEIGRPVAARTDDGLRDELARFAIGDFLSATGKQRAHAIEVCRRGAQRVWWRKTVGRIRRLPRVAVCRGVGGHRILRCAREIAGRAAIDHVPGDAVHRLPCESDLHVGRADHREIELSRTAADARMRDARDEAQRERDGQDSHGVRCPPTAPPMSKKIARRCRRTNASGLRALKEEPVPTGPLLQKGARRDIAPQHGVTEPGSAGGISAKRNGAQAPKRVVIPSRSRRKQSRCPDPTRPGPRDRTRRHDG